VQSNSSGSIASSNRLGPFLSKLSGTLAPLLFLLLLSVILSFLSPHFAERGNIKQILIQAAVVAILACGQTAVIISGNIDLSVGAVMAFSGVAAAEAMHQAGANPAGTLPSWMILILSLPAAILAGWLALKAVTNLAAQVVTGVALALALPILLACGFLIFVLLKSLAAAEGIGKIGLIFLSLMAAALAVWMVQAIRKRPHAAIALSVFLMVEALSGWLLQHIMEMHGVNMWGGVAVACACGLSAGLLTGLLTAYGRIPSFIVTLGMMGVAYGMGGILSHSQAVSGLAPGFKVFGTRELFGDQDHDGLPYGVLIMLGVTLVVYILLARTRWGRYLYSIGGNGEAARLSGVPITLVTTTVFALSGLLAGVASVLNVSRTSVAQFNAGDGLELYAVAATVIGGTSLFGGQGGVLGTILGALLMFTIKDGCNLLGVDTTIERVVIGAVVILAVLYDRYLLPLVRRGVEQISTSRT
jgi:ribose transport system permease protein